MSQAAKYDIGKNSIPTYYLSLNYNDYSNVVDDLFNGCVKGSELLSQVIDVIPSICEGKSTLQYSGTNL